MVVAKQLRIHGIDASAPAGSNAANGWVVRVQQGKKYLSPISMELLSFKLDAPSPCRLDAPDLDLICYASADCLHQHLQVI